MGGMMRKKRKWKLAAPRDHPLYATYVSMLHRCYNRDNRAYHNYGGRGIYVSDDWLPDGTGRGFWQFVKDVGPRPSDEKYPSGRPKWSLDRKDNEGPYRPENMVWATQSQQCLNRRSFEWSPERRYKALPAKVGDLRPSPITPGYYFESSFQIKWTGEDNKPHYVLVCNRHLSEIRSKYPLNLELTGVSAQKPLCVLCQKEG